MRTYLILFLTLLSLALAPAAGLAQREASVPPPPPEPVEGTEMIPSEYGEPFPKEIIWPKDGSVMVLVPHGTFTMGLDAEAGGEPNEGPAHEVTLPSFYIDKYEVTNKQYIQFLLAGNSTAARPRPSLNEMLMSDERPVTAIDWSSARKYADWAGKKLPTEAMWERAARGPENTLYTTGNQTPTKEQLVVGRGSEGLTDSVRSNTPDVSGYGVHHMGGNVSEWTGDWFQRDYYEESPKENPMGPESGEARTARGGNFFFDVDRAKAVYREAYPPTQIRDWLGFRTVWVPKPPPPPEERPTPTPSPTPEPSREEIVANLIKQLLPHLESKAPKLPKELLAGRVYTSQGWNALQFVNFTPYDISLTFAGPNEELVYRYDEPLPKMTYRNVSLPRERDLCILAYSPNAPRKGPINIGCLRAESFAKVVIQTEMLSPVVTLEGEAIPLMEKPVPDYYYGEFNPMWNEIEVLNPFDEPLVLTLKDTTVSRENPQVIGEFTMEAGEVRRMSLRPGRYDFRIDYIGAMGESSAPVEVTVDDTAARRLLLVQEDATRTGGVTVIAKERPYLTLELVEARPVGFPEGQITDEPQ